MSSGKQLLVGFKKRWWRMQVLEVLLYAMGPALLIYFLGNTLLGAVLVLLVISLLVLSIRKPWRLSLDQIGHFLDRNLELTEYSTGLLLLPTEKLTGLAKLQKRKVNQVLTNHIHSVRPAVSLRGGMIVLGIFLVLSFLAWKFQINERVTRSSQGDQNPQMSFIPLDSARNDRIPPKLEFQELVVQYPRYTNMGTIRTTDMNVRALEGSRLTWQLKFDGPVAQAAFEGYENSYPMNRSEGGFVHRMSLRNSGFYHFSFETQDTTSYQSPLYALEMYPDEYPTLEVQKLKQFTSFDYEDDKTLSFQTEVRDDFGIAEAYIIATVSKGQGESVKFREERLLFERGMVSGGRTLQLTKEINLDRIGMEPGDELYFYVSVVDNKEPKPNVTRSETYFAVIRDTLTDQFGVEGTMGANLMPDYFRSQRQLIIDTEKLIAGKNKMSREEFNSTSNALGFDQKSLRLKYGEFMGDEAESGIAITQEIPKEESDDHDAHDHESHDDEDEDPLSEYTHDHDGAGEHHPLDHDHEGHDQGEHQEEHEGEDPLESYLHNHDDPEESTLFTQSLKSKLRQAMAEMWDAELYLRLYTPEKSLPYQYRALKLIQEIKNSARIYVHRIGFDPPPIKEDKRLTGDLDKIVSFRKMEEVTLQDAFVFLRKASERLEELRTGQGLPREEDRLLFSEAGKELAQLAVAQPGQHLATLQKLKWLADGKQQWSPSEFRKVLRGVLAALPPSRSRPTQQDGQTGHLDELFLKELEINE